MTRFDLMFQKDWAEAPIDWGTMNIVAPLEHEMVGGQ